MPGVPSPLANREVGDIDFYVVVRTVGVMPSVGGIMNEGTSGLVLESVFTRRGVDRIMRYTFELAKTRAKRRDVCHQIQRDRDLDALLGPTF